MATSAALDAIRGLESRGLFLSAHDRAMVEIAAGDSDDRLRHRAVLTLARAGATAPALALLRELKLIGSADPEIAGLQPRLLKDVALASGHPADAAAAAAAYEQLWLRHQDGWYGVNAAAMRVLACDPAASHALAAAVRALPDAGDYWSAATQAETALLLGDPVAAARWLEQAEQRAGSDLACRAATRRQLHWESALLGFDRALVDILRIPDTVHFCGLIPGAPADETALRQTLAPLLRDVGFAFGGLAAGADIVATEILLAHDAMVTAVLPFPPDIFIEHSVRPAGEDWVARFHACLACVQVHVLDDAPQDDLDYGLAGRRAMGMARLHAQRLDGAAWQLAIWDGGGTPGAAGTATDVAGWHSAGGDTRVVTSPWPRRRATSEPCEATAARIPTRTLAAVLFGDLPRFSALDDRQLLAFYQGPLAAMGNVVDGYASAYRNAWGDAVQLVFHDPETAALCAFGLDAASAEATTAESGLPPGLRPRLALDYGGLHAVFDAVQRADKFAGRVMTRAARIEPVTPPGLVYATEAFACEIALRPGAAVTCDYAGRVPLAKNFGIIPLYLVRPVKTGWPVDR